ncbi:hypothetical protein ACJX0J_006212, partial [Zea mays]
EQPRDSLYGGLQLFIEKSVIFIKTQFAYKNFCLSSWTRGSLASSFREGMRNECQSSKSNNLPN